MLQREEDKLSHTKDYEKWMARSQDAHRAAKLPFGDEIWTGRSDVALRGVPDSARVHDNINVGFAFKRLGKDESPATSAEDLWINFSQSVDRTAVSKPLIPCFTSSSTIYSYQFDCVLTGASHMRMMGWPLAKLAGWDNNALRGLAGDGFGVPVAALVQGVLYRNPYASWWVSPWQVP